MCYHSQIMLCIKLPHLHISHLIGAVALPSGLFAGILDTHLTDVGCDGSEYDLLSCLITISGQCNSNEDAAVVCQGGLKCNPELCCDIITIILYLYYL